MWSADRGGTAGKAPLHLRIEDGTIHVFGDRVGLFTTTPTFDIGLGSGANRTISIETPSGAAGKDLTVAAGGGDGDFNGGVLYLKGGTGTIVAGAAVSGNAYLMPGDKAGVGSTYGNTILGYDGSTFRGNIGIKTGTASSFDVNLRGDANFIIGMNRDDDASGNVLTLQAGGAFQAADLFGGELRLSSGISRGNKDSFITFYTPTAGASASADRSPVEKFRITGDGRFYGTSLHNNLGAMTGTTNQYVGSGTYTPTLTNVTNVAASTAYSCQWIRVGNVVTVSGKVDIDATLSASTTSELGMSLPIASSLTAEEQVGGTAVSDAIASDAVRIKADATNDRASFVWKSISLTNDSFNFTFTYVIL